MNEKLTAVNLVASEDTGSAAEYLGSQANVMRNMFGDAIAVAGTDVATVPEGTLQALRAKMDEIDDLADKFVDAAQDDLKIYDK